MGELLLKRKYKKSVKQYLQFTTTNKIYKKNISKKSTGFALYYVKLFDLVDNQGMNKLVRSLYNLNDKLFNVDVYFSKPKFKDICYTQMQINQKSEGTLAKIELKSDFYIKTIELAYSQINNQQFVVCYKFKFRKAINTVQLEKEFIKNNIKRTYNGHYQSLYDMKSITLNKKFDDISQIEDVFFRDILQSYIVSLLYTDLGNRYKLPTMFCFDYSNSEGFEEELKKSASTNTFYNSKENYYLVIDNNDKYCGMQMFVYFNSKTIPDVNFMNYFSTYGNEFYYYLFENIECMELNMRVGKYLSSKKKHIRKKDCIWTINKYNSINDNELTEVHIENEGIWNNYKDGIKTEKQFVTYPKYINKYEDIYSQHVDYLTSLFNIQNRASIVGLAGFISVLIAILGVITWFSI